MNPLKVFHGRIYPKSSSKNKTTKQIYTHHTSISYGLRRKSLCSMCTSFGQCCFLKIFSSSLEYNFYYFSVPPFNSIVFLVPSFLSSSSSSLLPFLFPHLLFLSLMGISSFDLTFPPRMSVVFIFLWFFILQSLEI